MVESPLERFLAVIETTTGKRPRRSGDGWLAHCPAHRDRSPSLSIGEGDGARVLVKCHAGCTLAAIVAAVGMTERDLFPDQANGHRNPNEPDASYDYVDEYGTHLFQVVRLPGKKFRQRRPDGTGGWVWKLGDTRRALYRSDRIFEAIETDTGATVWVVEGEKDAHSLERLGLLATTCPGGALKWRPEHTEQLKSAPKVVILPDADEPGRRHAQHIAAELHAAGAPDVRILDLHPQASDGSDASDWLAPARTDAELAQARARLEQLADQAPPPTADKPPADHPSDSWTPRNLALLGDRPQVRPTLDGAGAAEVDFGPPVDHTAVQHGRELTDLGNARRFAADHQHRLRYVVQRRRWLVWRDGRWREDDDGEHDRAAKHTVETMLARAITLDGDTRKHVIKHALNSQEAPRLRRMLDLAGTEPELALTVERLDADPWILSCQNGTLDLRTGELRPRDPADLISLGSQIPYEPSATCPRWQRFLLEAFADDPELVEFVRRAIGYSLTGDTREHALFICHGAGANGKTTFLETAKRLLGGLAATAAFDTFARARGDRGPRNDLARLHRARLVAAAESGEGRRLDEATVKQITGGDTVAARFLYGEHFEYRPAFKLWLATNHRPRVDGDDDAIWRRIRLIPFNVSFRGREDRELEQTLAAELPGILTWAVQGCLAWQSDGLGSAGAVDEATAEYRQEEDVLGAFLTERCELGAGHETAPADLRTAYETYRAELGEKPVTASVLGKQLSRRGIKRGGRNSVYRGLRLR